MEPCWKKYPDRQPSPSGPGRKARRAALTGGSGLVAEYGLDGGCGLACDLVGLFAGQAKRRRKAENVALRHGPPDHVEDVHAGEQQPGEHRGRVQAQRRELGVASQRGEGWMTLEDAYDDPGFSGGTTERPAHVAKNRLSLPDEFPLDHRIYAAFARGENPLTDTETSAEKGAA